MINDGHQMIIRKAAVEIGGSFTNLAFQVVDGSVSARSQLAQSRPSDTTAVSILAPDEDTTYLVGNILVANTQATDVTFRIFHDHDGTTYDESTALFYDVSIQGNSTVSVELFLAMKQGGNLAVRTSLGNAITFTAYGLTLV